MVNILSWNIHTYKGRKTKQLKQTIIEIVNENNIHVVVFQEAFGKMVKWAVNGGFFAIRRDNHSHLSKKGNSN
jgi:hypothetical protein